MEQKEKYWSRFANDFEERNNYVIGKADLEAMLAKLSQQKELKNVLELGCGNGTYSRIIAKNADQLLATDFSDEMANASEIRLKSISNITVEKANCFNLPYADNSFDTIFMANLLHIIPQPEKAISEVKRVLKKDGTIIIVSYTSEGMKFHNILKMIYRYMKTYGKPSPFAQKIKLTDAQNMLVKKDFKITEASLIGIKMKAIFVTAQK